MLVLRVYLIIIFLLYVLGFASAAAASQPRTASLALSVTPLEKAPAATGHIPDDSAIAAAKQAVVDKPKDRGARFLLVQLLQRAGRLEEALAAAKAWRVADAYNLVVVRLMGDLLSELNRPKEARRIYSAVVELLPKDAQAHRALATVLKQQGDMETAYLQLKSAAEERPEDVRLAFELADAAARKGNREEALQRFAKIISKGDAPDAIVYPAKQLSAQLLSEKKRSLLAEGNTDAARQTADEISRLKVKGGALNDIKVFLTWDTDGSDVDLWVTNPAGDKIFYSAKQGRFGGELFHDVTTGYGPESFTATAAHTGTYTVQVNYYATNRSAFREARGEVVIITNEGRAGQKRIVLPYRLFEPGQTVTVAEIKVK
ncbi:MAG: tetratricopeptide repeat protein [Deltaproteobacteria bacterium]|nr:tetratricopeptide repeat protein [Deltaproteobacteria bacterium]